MELATNNMANFPSHMLSDSMANPIWGLMDDLVDTKNEAINNFESEFYNEILNQSDSEIDSMHNDASENLPRLTENRSSVSEDENSINYPMTQNIDSQTCFPENIISQAASMGPYDMMPNRFDWSNFAQPNSTGVLTSFPSGNLTVGQTPESNAPRRSSFSGTSLGNLPEYPDLSNSRKRVYSWGDLSSTAMNMDGMDFSQSAHRSAANIQLQKNQDSFIDIMNQNNGKVPTIEEEFSSPASFTFEDGVDLEKDKKSKGASPKKSMKSANEPELPQTVVEKRLNRRRERNRLAARRSREKRTQFLHDLERVNQALQSENGALKSKLCEVLQELEILRSSASQR
ncbi:hypothetical protein K7432_013983 [Basidiobolus ranarum]|uniref:BZIP domain-containing protein n=1 Tax=Basidiobolus ranarum TaxID=34480 RepID=A0ABR2VQ22_9FUNG